MSDFEFVLVEKIGFTLQETVFEFVVGGGRGATGAGLPSGGTDQQLVRKVGTVDFVYKLFTLTKSFIGLGNVTDDAQLKRSAGDFQAFTERTSPQLTDVSLLEDSGSGGVKKWYSFTSLKALFFSLTQNKIWIGNGSGQAVETFPHTSEVFSGAGSVGLNETLNVDLGNGGKQSVTITGNNATVTVINWPVSGVVGYLTLEINGAGAFTGTVITNSKTSEGAALDFSSGRDKFQLDTNDAGVTVDVSQVGKDYS